MAAPATPPPPSAFPDWTSYTLDESPWWILALRLYQRRVAPRQMLTGATDLDVRTVLGPRPEESVASKDYAKRKEELQGRWQLSYGPDWQPVNTRSTAAQDWTPAALALHGAPLPDPFLAPAPGRWMPGATGWTRSSTPTKPSPKELEELHGTHAVPTPQTFLVVVEADRLALFLAQAEQFLVLVRMAQMDDRIFHPVPGPPLVLHQPLLELLAATPIMDPIDLLKTSWVDAQGREHPVPSSREAFVELESQLKTKHGDGPLPPWFLAPEWRRLVGLKVQWQEAQLLSFEAPLWRPILWPDSGPPPGSPGPEPSLDPL